MNWQHALDIDLDVPAAFGDFLAGLIVGEGCFVIVTNTRNQGITCRFSMELRDDDSPLIQEIQRILRIGTIMYRERKPFASCKNICPQVTFAVNAIGDVIHVLIPLLEKTTWWKSKKQQDYELWKQAAWLVYNNQHLTLAGRAEILRLKAIMEAGRKYNGNRAQAKKGGKISNKETAWQLD